MSVSRAYTEQQEEEVYAYIVFYKEEHDGIPPTLSEIIENCLWIGNITAARRVLESLEKQGKITWGKGKRRYIKVIGGKWRLY